MVNNERDTRSMSHDLDDSGSESTSRHNDDSKDGGGSSAPGKPGRKKNPNSAAARRDQNRIAQREFRLRKQQRIRDLEARVEILSGSKDETYSELRNIVKDLMAENMTLRNLIRSLGSYIGDGLGGLLPSLGFDRPQEFVDFVNKAETDTAFEGFARRKKEKARNQMIDLSRKRALPDEPSSSKKRQELDDHSGASTTDKDRFPTLLPPISPATNNVATSTFPDGSHSEKDSGIFHELLGGQYLQRNPADSSRRSISFPPGFLSNISPIDLGQYMPAVPTSAPPSAIPTGAMSSLTQVPTAAPVSDTADDDKQIDDPKLQEATKLIRYHLDNYKRNNAYCLPQSLRPTLVQRTVPHESVIDGIPHPELRDRMILLRGRFDLVDCLHEYINSLTLHGDDVLAHLNWEISEKWLRRFGFLVDQPLLNVCNRWRRERGEPDLTMADVSHAQPDGSPIGI